MEIEYYSHVMHIVSSINGELSSKKDIIDILYSCFPAGTVTGAPKIRAIEIIHKLEKCRRGFYAGAIGYFDFRGNMNTCIAIRTMVMKNKKWPTTTYKEEFFMPDSSLRNSTDRIIK